MKTLLTIFVAFSIYILPQSVRSQCPPGNFYPDSQGELDTFLINYPNCTNFQGDIRLDESDIDDLTPLQNLTSIGGYLVVRFTQLTSLKGLENLTSVGGLFSIYDNDQLPSMEGVTSLTSIGDLDIQFNNLLTEVNLSGLHSIGGIFIGSNPMLTSMNLSSINSVPGNVYITTNDQLTSLQGLENISNIGGYLTILNNPDLINLEGLDGLTSIGQNLQILSNQQLASLNALTSLETIGGFLEILDNNALSNLNGMQNITSVNGYLSIQNNPNLQTLNLSNLNSINGALQIINNDELNSLESINGINPQSISTLEITDNASLSTCDQASICEYLTLDPSAKPRTISGNALGCATEMAVQESCMPDLPECPVNVVLNTQAQVDEFGQLYGHCTEITGNVTIQGADITDLSPLNHITSIGGNISINFCGQLSDLQGLENITSVGGILNINNNSSLTSLNGLGNLTSVGGRLGIANNASLTSLAGLGSLTSIGGQITIVNNDKISSLTGLNKLTSVRLDLFIEDNDMLTSLDGLENITSVGAYLSIDDNAALNSIEGLNNLTSVGLGLFVTNNPMLESLNGLQNLTSIGLSLSISANYNLTSFNELENLTSIGGYLLISYSANLESLAGLENIDPTTITNLLIYYNPLLSICDLPNICIYLTYDPVDKPRSISENATGCATETEVAESCMPEEVSVVSVESLPNITVECSTPPVDPDLPDSVGVNYSNNTSGNVAVTWDLSAYDGSVGSHQLTGTLDLTAEENPDKLMASISVIVEDKQAPIPDSENLADITAQCEITENDVTPPTATDNCTDGTITATTDFAFPTAADGTITWTFEDEAGNITTQTQNIIIEASALPVIECPASHIISCDTFVTFDLPIATGDCGTARLIQTDRTGFTSGSDFPIGTTTLTYKATNGFGSASCKIEIEVLPPLEIQHVSGVGYGDTLRVADCLPPDHSKANLDLGAHQNRSSLSGGIYKRELPPNPEFGLWKISLYTYSVTDQCGNSDYFENYVALYDLKPPDFRNFPRDTTIDSPADLPPVPEDVRIIDICRYVVWDTVITTAVQVPETNDSLVFVRRWIAVDEVGNKSFRDQLIHVRSTPDPDLNNIVAHVVKEEDLINERFPFTAGTDHIPVTIYKQQMDHTFTPIDTMLTGNWMGRRGNLFFTSLLPGNYKLKIQLPQGYSAIHPDSLLFENGWSDTLTLAGDSTLNLATILLVPDMSTDTSPALSVMEEPAIDARSESSNFSIYPNPTTGRIKFEMPGGGSFDYTIFNHLGQIVRIGKTENGSEIDLSRQVNGMYFIRIMNGPIILGMKRILLIDR